MGQSKSNKGFKSGLPATGTKRTKPTPTVAPMIVRAPRRAPTHDDIAVRAYGLFVRRHYEHGHDVEDWLIAEAELMNGLV